MPVSRLDGRPRDIAAQQSLGGLQPPPQLAFLAAFLTALLDHPFHVAHPFPAASLDHPFHVVHQFSSPARHVAA